jgi:hypothetical protein
MRYKSAGGSAPRAPQWQLSPTPRFVFFRRALCSSSTFKILPRHFSSRLPYLFITLSPYFFIFNVPRVAVIRLPYFGLLAVLVLRVPNVLQQILRQVHGMAVS